MIDSTVGHKYKEKTEGAIGEIIEHLQGNMIRVRWTEGDRVWENNCNDSWPEEYWERVYDKSDKFKEIYNILNNENQP
jgi:hypothetical protein